jgi:hypothetical protein
MYRIAFTSLGFVFALLASAAPVLAGERDKVAEEQVKTVKAEPSAAVQPGEVDWSMAPVKFGRPSRGSVLPSLYLSLAGLNALDAHTTLRGVSLGASESNPLLKAAATHPSVLWAVKGGVTAGSVFMAERLWRKNHKAGAIAVMLVSNGMMAVVAARNMSVIRRQQTR